MVPAADVAAVAGVATVVSQEAGRETRHGVEWLGPAAVKRRNSLSLRSHVHPACEHEAQGGEREERATCQ